MDRSGDAYRFKYDKVRVAQSLTYQNDNLRPFAPHGRGAGGDHAQHARLRACDDRRCEEMAKLWQIATVTDVEGDYLLHITGPEAFAEAIAGFIDGKVTSSAG